MASTKAGGSTRQKGNRPGRRLGVKIFGGQPVAAGHILVRQKGSRFKAASGVGVGRDYTLYAQKPGILKFITRHGRQYLAVA